MVQQQCPTTSDDREEHTASVMRCVGLGVVYIGRGRMRRLRAGGRDTAIPAIAIDSGYLNERDDQLQESAEAPILVGKCDRDRWIGAAIVPTKGADEYAIAELKNDVSGSCFAEVLVRSDNGPAVLGLEGTHSDSVEVGRWCLVRLAEQWVGRERFGQEFPGGHPVLPWLVECSAAMANRCRRGPDGKTAYELRKGRKFARELPHFAGGDPLHDPWGHDECGES